MEVGSLGCEEADGHLDEYQETDDTFLVEEDWVDEELGHGRECDRS